MDSMDIDDIVDVPDTPDRLAKLSSSKKHPVEEKNNSSSIACHLISRKFFEEMNEIQPVTINNGNGSLSMRPPKSTSSSGNWSHPHNSATPSKAGISIKGSYSSKSCILFRKETPASQSHESIHSHPVESPSFNSKRNSSSFQDSNLVQLTQRGSHRPAFRNDLLGGMPGSGRFQSRNGSGLSKEPFSSHDLTDSALGSSISEGRTDTSGNISSSGSRQSSEVFGNIQNKPVDSGSFSLDTIVPPRLNKQKKLVRNGCISPHNIAKAKQLAVKGHNVVAKNNNVRVTSCGSPVSIDVREIVAEDDSLHNRKGKGVIIYPCSSKEPELKNLHLLSRSSSGFNVKAMETRDYIRDTDKCTEEGGGWRSICHKPRESNSTSSREEMEALTLTCKHHDNGMPRREKGSRVATDNDKLEDSDGITSGYGPHLPIRQTVSYTRTREGGSNGHPFPPNKLIKRKKEGSSVSNFGKCSTSVLDESDVVFIRSSAEPSNLRSTSGIEGNLRQTIEVHELSPDLRPNPQEEDARAKQVESDELLARELQEQLYNDVPILGVGERVSLVSNSRRQSQSRPSSNLLRRGSQSQASILGRITRTRSRFPGSSRTLLPSRGGTSMFPEDMDVDMRMDILGALEAFSEMEVGAGILQTQRDFNENDYETLLALDENNDRHGGASVHQINGLPLSTVQNDNFDEACAICLETPTTGDAIRHLPCLHKFHKDCIDSWLRRKRSCPICKSSIS